MPKPPLDPMMPLENAHAELEGLVNFFHNEMKREGITENPPDRWVNLFRDWLAKSPLANAKFGRQYKNLYGRRNP